MQDTYEYTADIDKELRLYARVVAKNCNIPRGEYDDVEQTGVYAAYKVWNYPFKTNRPAAIMRCVRNAVISYGRTYHRQKWMSEAAQLNEDCSPATSTDTLEEAYAILDHIDFDDTERFVVSCMLSGEQLKDVRFSLGFHNDNAWIKFVAGFKEKFRKYLESSQYLLLDLRQLLPSELVMQSA